ncbi:DUF3048 domain-containing protein [Kitasatospora sp. NPDC004240]
MRIFGQSHGRRPAVLVLVVAAALFATLLAVLLTTGGGGSPAPSTAPTTAPATGVPPDGGPAPGDAPDATVSPLTGLPGGAGRVIAVKVDNSSPARPQTGLGAADVVDVIQVEGGISRFLAVYDSGHLPPGDRIGPVRSARESDLPLLGAYGRVAFAYSGAQTPFLPVLDRADVINSSPAQVGNAFLRSGGRVAPYNEYLVPSAVLEHAPDAAQARDVGFRFGDAPAGGVPTAVFGARMPAASFTFTWSAAQGRYLVAMDGRPAMTTDAGQLGASTVVVQKVARATSPRGLVDSSGQVVPFAPTVGGGEAVFLRDGAAYRGTWSRPDENAGTEYRYAGQRMAFRPGQVWVVLEPS